MVLLFWRHKQSVHSELISDSSLMVRRTAKLNGYKRGDRIKLLTKTSPVFSPHRLWTSFLQRGWESHLGDLKMVPRPNLDQASQPSSYTYGSPVLGLLYKDSQSDLSLAFIPFEELVWKHTSFFFFQQSYHYVLLDREWKSLKRHRMFLLIAIRKYLVERQSRLERTSKCRMMIIASIWTNIRKFVLLKKSRSPIQYWKSVNKDKADHDDEVKPRRIFMFCQVFTT